MSEDDVEPQGDFPHQIVERYMAERLGRAADLYGEFADDLFSPLVRGVADQLSIYLDQRPMAQFRIGTASLREGAERAYIFVPLKDRGGPLRLREAFEYWDFPSWATKTHQMVEAVNGRRWRFVDRHLMDVMEPVLRNIGEAMSAYYARRPHAKPKAGIVRFLEQVDNTMLCVEIDDRSVATTTDAAPRYRVQ